MSLPLPRPLPLMHKVSLWTRNFTGSVSTLSSSLIIYMMLSDRDFKLKEKPNNRILLSMSIIDVFQSLAYALHTIPLPVSSGVYHAIGNKYTCAIQGFCIQLGLAVPAYNASLCIWYLMAIKYNMRHETFAKKVEPYCHAYSILVPLSSACIIAGFDHFQQRGYVCWIGYGLPYMKPFLILSTVQLAVAFTVVVYCLLRVYCTVHQLEQQMMRYSHSPSGIRWTSSSSNGGGLTLVKKKFAVQMALFSFAFVMTFLFPVVNAIVSGSSSSDSESESDIEGSSIPPGISSFHLPTNIFLPLQGFWNLIIYSHPVILRIMREYPEFKILAAIRMMICHPEQIRPRIITRRRRSSLLLNQNTNPLSASASPRSRSRRRLSLGDNPTTGTYIDKSTTTNSPFIRQQKRLSLPYSWKPFADKNIFLTDKDDNADNGNNGDNCDIAEIASMTEVAGRQMQEDIQRALEGLKLEEGGDEYDYDSNFDESVLPDSRANENEHNL